MSVYGVEGVPPAGEIAVRNSIFRDHQGAGVGELSRSAIECGLDGASVSIMNNLFTGNGITAMRVWGNSSLFLTRNTVAHNGRGAFLQTAGPSFVTNNVLYANTVWTPATPDLVLAGGSQPVVSNNVIGVLVGTPHPTSNGNSASNPQFLGRMDLHLQPASPAVNAGEASPPGGLPALDLEGRPRVVGPAPDLGAYESSVLPVDLSAFSIE